MEDVAIGVLKKDKPVALVLEWLAEELNSVSLERFVGRVEIIDRDREMADTGIPELGLRGRTLRMNDLYQRAIRRFDNKVACLFEVNVEAEMLNVPIGEMFGIGRGDRRVLKAKKHKSVWIVAERDAALSLLASIQNVA